MPARGALPVVLCPRPRDPPRGHPPNLFGRFRPLSPVGTRRDVSRRTPTRDGHRDGLYRSPCDSCVCCAKCVVPSPVRASPALAAVFAFPMLPCPFVRPPTRDKHRDVRGLLCGGWAHAWVAIGSRGGVDREAQERKFPLGYCSQHGASVPQLRADRKPRGDRGVRRVGSFALGCARRKPEGARRGALCGARWVSRAPERLRGPCIPPAHAAVFVCPPPLSVVCCTSLSPRYTPRPRRERLEPPGPHAPTPHRYTPSHQDPTTCHPNPTPPDPIPPRASPQATRT